MTFPCPRCLTRHIFKATNSVINFLVIWNDVVPNYKKTHQNHSGMYYTTENKMIISSSPPLAKNAEMLRTFRPTVSPVTIIHCCTDWYHANISCDLAVTLEMLRLHLIISCSSHGRTCARTRARLCPYWTVSQKVTRCDFFREEAHVMLQACFSVVKFAHHVNLISEQVLLLLWTL